MPVSTRSCEPRVDIDRFGFMDGLASFRRGALVGVFLYRGGNRKFVDGSCFVKTVAGASNKPSGFA
jgi:hypothetical protein